VVSDYRVIIRRENSLCCFLFVCHTVAKKHTNYLESYIFREFNKCKIFKREWGFVCYESW